jgi:outer membrane protein assembly complex protein YaeT
MLSVMGSRAASRLLSLCVALTCLAACKEEGGVKVSSFTFKGNERISKGQLEQVLATHASSRLPWGQKRYFNREQFEADLKRIVAFYTDRGFPDARVTSFDVKLSDDQSSVAITLNISEGQPTVVERIAFEGFDSLPARRRQRLEQMLPLKPGQPLDRALMQASRETALDQLRDNGHPYASVRIGESPGSNDHARVLELQADPGTQAQIGDIDIQGNSSVSDDVVRRHLTFKPGDLYRVGRLRESQRQLYTLELFQFANIEPLNTEGEPPVVPVRVTVTEGKHRRVDLSGGYGSEERARAEIDWRHVNFFGGARTAGVRARYSGLDGGVRVNLTQPYVFSPRYALGLSGQAWHSAEPAFTLNTQGGRVTLTRQFARGGVGRMPGRAPRMTLAMTYANERESYEISDEALTDLSFRDELIALGLDPRRGSAEGTRSALILDATRNTTDNLLDAKRGYMASLHLEQAGTFLGGSFDYYELTGEGRFYQKVGNALVLAAQVRGGSIDAQGDPEVRVPFFKRYFLGGAANLRGWGRFEVAPLSGFGLPIGGHTFMIFSTEARFPVWSRLAGVLFLDGGNVWTDAWDFNPGDLRYDVGPGLRYNTPIGPLRVDFAYQLNPIDGLLVNGEPQSRRFRIHFSIGQAF